MAYCLRPQATRSNATITGNTCSGSAYLLKGTFARIIECKCAVKVMHILCVHNAYFTLAHVGICTSQCTYNVGVH